MRGLEPDFQRYVPDTPLCVRIRHNQVLDDDEVLSLWRSCLGDEQILDQVVFATQDDGLLWLDTWLDKPASGRFLLSLELNLFLSPVAEQAESVSAVLLAQADTETDQRFEPLAWLHRPVRLTVQAGGWENALFWGKSRRRARNILPGTSSYPAIFWVISISPWLPRAIRLILQVSAVG
ncbi:hypothetical protein QNM99_25050 [Pseudomonas sp. PCH446]